MSHSSATVLLYLGSILVIVLHAFFVFPDRILFFLINNNAADSVTTNNNNDMDAKNQLQRVASVFRLLLREVSYLLVAKRCLLTGRPTFFITA